MRRVVIGDYDYRDEETIAVGNSSVRFSVSKILTDSRTKIECRAAECRLETADIRYTLVSGGDPALGMLLQAGETLTVLGTENVKRFRAIKAGINDGTLIVHYGW